MTALQRLLVMTSSTLPRQCITGGVLFATGDIIAQQLIEKKAKQHDFLRTSRLAFYGGVIFSPLVSIWLGKVLEKVSFKNRYYNIAAKVALDQGIAAPNMVALFFTATTLMAGGSKIDVENKLKSSWWSTLQTNWAVWIPVQAINMAFIPPPQRLLFVNVISIFWNTFLSVMSSNSNKSETTDTDQLIELERTKVD